MQHNILEGRVAASDFTVLSGVAEHFDEIYSRMVDFAMNHPIDGTKRKTERFPKAIADIVEEVTQVDYGLLNAQAEEPIKQEREYLFVMFLTSYVQVYGESSLFPYRNIEDMCRANSGYEPFRSRTPEEQEQLVTYANWMQLAMRFRRPNANKGSLLVSIPIAAEKKNHPRYITGTGATRSTKDRIGVYEVEGQTTPAPRPNRRRDDDWTTTPSTGSTSRGTAAGTGSGARTGATTASSGARTAPQTPYSGTSSTSSHAPRRGRSERSDVTSPVTSGRRGAAPTNDDDLLDRVAKNSPSPQTPKVKTERGASRAEQEQLLQQEPQELSGLALEEDIQGWAFDESLLDALEKEEAQQPAGYVPSYASQLLQETKLVGDFVLEEDDETSLADLVARWGLQTANDIERLFDIESR